MGAALGEVHSRAAAGWFFFYFKEDKLDSFRLSQF